MLQVALTSHVRRVIVCPVLPWLLQILAKLLAVAAFQHAGIQLLRLVSAVSYTPWCYIVHLESLLDVREGEVFMVD
ncbi:hypothetical protein DEU56DRAFT_811930 [Suillus clintonianus]|uniref:uncharacterized protein n=1 Tax=Suillus clintonianus TaxID=1904413 RepID=UPI001B86F890|nr:uncharacterized protein DEU56DRAFT_811930 [Suillus clintonianus]KAG2132767.1 hypothetical protein DEU56DRAFT_811930 [Suillus clintonianus]